MKVVYSGSRNLYPYMVSAIRSLMAYNDVEKIYLLIEDDKFPYPLPGCCETRNISKQTYFPKDGANYRTSFTYMSLMRVCYGSLFPDDDRIIQLDVDTIICDDLSEIWEIDLDGKWFAMCPEVQTEYRPFGKDKVYYNAGVAVFNLDQIRKDGIEKVLVDFLNTTEVPYIDQDAWNYFGQEKSVGFSTRYNECFVTRYSANPAIVHFAGFKDWMYNRRMFRKEYLQKWLIRTMRYMIHTCNQREWYVDEYLVPSLVEGGIPEENIIVWRDKDSIGNLASFAASCKWIGENLEPHGSVWHLQDDICVSKRFFDVTSMEHPGLANGFCNNQFDGGNVNYLGKCTIDSSWFSFQCIHIPNQTAKNFAKWYEEECIPKRLHADLTDTGKCDDQLFQRYIKKYEHDLPVTNIFPCIVDHIDYLIGGTVANKARTGDKRIAYHRDKSLDDAVAELEKKLNGRGICNGTDTADSVSQGVECTS